MHSQAMKKRSRQLLMITSFLVFAAAAPLIILYAMGYRLSPQDGAGSVGVVLLESVPTRADTYADGVFLGRTPESIPNIRNESVRVRVAAPGYIPWEKTLTVAPGRATEVRDIRLFPEEPQRTVLASDVEMFSVSPSRRLIAMTQENNHLSIIDTDGEPISRTVILPEAPTALLWSPDSSSLVVTSSRSLPRFVNAATARVTTLSSLRGAHDFAWDPRVASRLLYVGADDNLHALNIGTGAREQLAETVSEFATSARHIFALSPDNTVRVSNLQGEPVTPRSEFPEPIAGLYVTPGGDIAGRAVDGSLHVVDEAGEVLTVSEALVASGWSPNGSMLFVQPDLHTLHVYNVRDERWPLSQHELHLVQRLSRPVTNVQWFAGGRHLLYQVDDAIIISEIDTRDYPVTYQVDSVNLGDAKSAVGEDGETLFYLKETEGVRELIAAKLALEQ